MKPIDTQITYDFICPWCWIGHRNLKAAIGRMSTEAAPAISYVPYELNPDMPVEGADRKAYRTAKFGSWARSQAMDAEVAMMGRRAGLDFNYDLITVTPNTRLAHRLMAFAQQTGDAAMAEALFDAIFAAYFSRGEHIGLIDVLVPLAVSAGFDAQAVRDHLSGTDGEAQIVAAQAKALREGVRSVPTIRIGNAVIAGAQPPSIMEKALQAGVAEAI
ncbi:DsbA family oxidoreductase [Cupriavidus basilensis]|uniref:DsbA family oxidoreductase n=1 Tax=Cupriavidus basilensis TaxID=68895 RepID=A0A643G6P2_9BURK|nr:DsbA family oxidoreductase [Cupriavidus basilensis]QOT77724.1 DsbA family oxidoreductase [Cupriavidus basilensis]